MKILFAILKMLSYNGGELGWINRYSKQTNHLSGCQAKKVYKQTWFQDVISPSNIARPRTAMFVHLSPPSGIYWKLWDFFVIDGFDFLALFKHAIDFGRFLYIPINPSCIKSWLLKLHPLHTRNFLFVQDWTCWRGFNLKCILMTPFLHKCHDTISL